MSWVHEARVGDRIICIDSEWAAWQLEQFHRMGAKYPLLNECYTIRGIFIIYDEPHFYLEEIVNPVVDFLGIGAIEQAWCIDIFRPAQRRDTDISALTALLTTAPAKVPEPA